MTVCFALESFLIPLLLVIRFVVAAPLGLIFPRLHRWLAVHASSLAINLKYSRDLRGDLESRMRRSEDGVLAIWVLWLLLAARGILPWRAFAIWLQIVSVASFINALPALGAQHYESDVVSMN